MIWSRRSRRLAACAVGMLIATAASAPGAAAEAPVSIGSKAFPESWILGEALVLLARGSGNPAVEHRSNMGGTEIVFAALESGSIDAYPEYTGTIAEVIVKSGARPSLAELRKALVPRGIGISEPLGFNDGYALATTRATAERLGLRTISDLARHPELRLGFTHEFIGRRDGFDGLARHYGLPRSGVRGIQHELAYRAMESGTLDVTDIYTTDAEIARLGLVVLEDDRAFFPRYDAVLLYRLALEREAPRSLAVLLGLAGRIDEARMIRANARVVIEHQPFATAAALLLAESGLGAGLAPSERSNRMNEILTATLQHLRLVAISLAAAIAIGVPLGVIATGSPLLAGVTLTAAGLLQTIPSLALLALLIPLFGVGVVPALVALFLYSLLPIVRNTYVGLTSIPSALEESARVLALTPATHLLRVRLPMASPSIMAGIKISAVINVGTATLAALIGGGGLGDPILSGIQLRRHDLILQGAIPAALLALAVQYGFDLIDRWIIPRGLRLPRDRST